MATVIVVVVAVLAGLAVWVALGRRGRSDRPLDGVSQFQRHIDALSPDARRAVIDRVRNDEGRDG
jgi:hypothetical protein